MTYDPGARLTGARERAHRLIYGRTGIKRSWPARASEYHDALEELLDAVDEARGTPAALALGPDQWEAVRDLVSTAVDHYDPFWRGVLLALDPDYLLPTDDHRIAGSLDWNDPATREDRP